ncbi:unnamed protein product [Callosobruchus maculatus]|uniref:Uncharacterized protein n=1 Tax=Callosobruchus maculatus TaxID=64391 RepID=A0A653BID0_CALMS|nr:unnamed protein product [Callosobruchus maculatus]
MGPRHTPPEHPWLFFATCFQIVQFRGLVAFRDLLGLPTYQFVYVRRREGSDSPWNLSKINRD